MNLYNINEVIRIWKFGHRSIFDSNTQNKMLFVLINLSFYLKNHTHSTRFHRYHLRSLFPSRTGNSWEYIDCSSGKRNDGKSTWILVGSVHIQFHLNHLNSHHLHHISMSLTRILSLHIWIHLVHSHSVLSKINIYS